MPEPYPCLQSYPSSDPPILQSSNPPILQASCPHQLYHPCFARATYQATTNFSSSPILILYPPSFCLCLCLFVSLYSFRAFDDRTKITMPFHPAAALLSTSSLVVIAPTSHSFQSMLHPTHYLPSPAPSLTHTTCKKLMPFPSLSEATCCYLLYSRLEPFFLFSNPIAAVCSPFIAFFAHGWVFPQARTACRATTITTCHVCVFEAPRPPGDAYWGGFFLIA